ncbi:MAG TPA: hypothetical protein VKB51_03475 [bacterium]|nr:hypothetical protein [bacterium]
MSGDAARRRAFFLRRLTAAMVVLFGLGTVITNGLPLLATDAARAELGHIPYPLFWFEFAMGWLYLSEGVAIAWRARWALPFAWLLAVIHSGSASGLWLWYLAGHQVEVRTLVMELFREGFWVLIALYLWRGSPPMPTDH